ncbi:MAG: SAM-dependent methyltransferase [Candidatus Binatia bacterium]
MKTNYSETVTTAREYYNSDDADNFYFHVWGGEDIHIGLYRSDDEPIPDASRRTVEYMASLLSTLDADSKVLDIGAGYGGAARWLAQNHGCELVAQNLSETENERNREMNREQGLDRLIEVIDGSFEKIPYLEGSFDVVWSQDAILHSGARDRVIAEAACVLKSGGEFVFTDPMQADDCPEGVLQPILDRIHLDSLGSPGFYREAAKRHGLEEVLFEDRSPQLVNHYSRVLAETERLEERLEGKVSTDYVERMGKGLRHWVEGGREGHLAWGIFLFRKP